MRRSFLGLAVVAATMTARPAAALELKELAAQVRPSVVHLTISGPTGEKIGNGTGFFVSPDGLIVTNYHVVEPAYGMRAKLSDGSEHAVLGLLGANPDSDVAIVQAAGSDFPQLELGSSLQLEQGDEVAVIGSPSGLEGTLSAGIVSAVRDNGVPEMAWDSPVTERRLIQITAPISPGSSGSPVVGADRKVVGVAVAVVGGQNLNLAVPVEAVHALLGTIRVDAAPQPFHSFPIENLVISVIFFGLVGAAFYFAGRIGKRRLS
jgi:S1-C subfamily serine protease